MKICSTRKIHVARGRHGFSGLNKSSCLLTNWATGLTKLFIIPKAEENFLSGEHTLNQIFAYFGLSFSVSDIWRTKYVPHTCQVGKVQKREISLFAPCQRGRFCVKPFCDIYFVHQHSNSDWNFENNEIFPHYKNLKGFIWSKTFNHCTWQILCWLSNAFSLQHYND